VNETTGMRYASVFRSGASPLPGEAGFTPAEPLNEASAERGRK